MSNGMIFDGEFFEGNINGNGTLIQPDGVKYTGSFINNRQHGEIITTMPDGRRSKALWENGAEVKSLPL